MDRFDPCGTDECKKRCDSYGVACDDIMADEIDRLRAELAECRSKPQAVTDATFDLICQVAMLRAALELIASPMRPDGTRNRDREACRQLAEKVLRDDVAK